MDAMKVTRDDHRTVERLFKRFRGYRRLSVRYPQ